MWPRGKVKIKWSPEFAYAIGLLTTDGNLSPDRRHINFTTKDKELAELFRECLGLTNAIGRKARGHEEEKKYYCVQFGDVIFYNFLLGIGLMPRKSKVLSELAISEKYFFHFLRGHFDGDGTFFSYWDPRWRSSFMFYTEFVSASRAHIMWLQGLLFKKLKVKGHITHDGRRICYQLKYAKKESLILFRKMYEEKRTFFLKRKYLKIKKALSIIGKRL